MDNSDDNDDNKNDINYKYKDIDNDQGSDE